MELDNKIYDKILKLCNEGKIFEGQEAFQRAIDKYSEALELIPLPKKNWEASTWLYGTLGDIHFMLGNYEKSKEYFFSAINCPDGISNPFILLRLGESFFECKEYKKSEEYLLRAYMLEGYKIFYHEDKKYFDLIKELI